MDNQSFYGGGMQDTGFYPVQKPKWYKNRRILILAAIGFILLVVVFIAGAGSGSDKSTDNNFMQKLVIDGDVQYTFDNLGQTFKAEQTIDSWKQEVEYYKNTFKEFSQDEIVEQVSEEEGKQYKYVRYKLTTKDGDLTYWTTITYSRLNDGKSEYELVGIDTLKG